MYVRIRLDIHQHDSIQLIIEHGRYVQSGFAALFSSNRAVW